MPDPTSAVLALADWFQRDHEGEPEGWNRAKTRDANGVWRIRRRPDLTPESEYEAP